LEERNGLRFYLDKQGVSQLLSESLSEDLPQSSQDIPPNPNPSNGTEKKPRQFLRIKKALNKKKAVTFLAEPTSTNISPSPSPTDAEKYLTINNPKSILKHFEKEEIQIDSNSNGVLVNSSEMMLDTKENSMEISSSTKETPALKTEEGDEISPKISATEPEKLSEKLPEKLPLKISSPIAPVPTKSVAKIPQNFPIDLISREGDEEFAATMEKYEKILEMEKSEEISLLKNSFPQNSPRKSSENSPRRQLFPAENYDDNSMEISPPLSSLDEEEEEKKNLEGQIGDTNLQGKMEAIIGVREKKISSNIQKKNFFEYSKKKNFFSRLRIFFLSKVKKVG
jgi:hypothetical protein